MYQNCGWVVGPKRQMPAPWLHAFSSKCKRLGLFSLLPKARLAAQDGSLASGGVRGGVGMADHFLAGTSGRSLTLVHGASVPALCPDVEQMVCMKAWHAAS